MTHEKIFQSTTFSASAHYQREELAGIHCLSQYDYIVYPQHASPSIAYFYNFYHVIKPTYIHIHLTKDNKLAKMNKSNSIPLIMRMSLNNIEEILASQELSDRSKNDYIKTLLNIIELEQTKLDKYYSNQNILGLTKKTSS